MKKARILTVRDYPIAPVPRALFGSFVEHMGSCVYNGIYQPGHPSADAYGCRQDVTRLVRELHLSVIRYPGGNFSSGYNWEDTVGPVRPRRLDLAWRSLEPNTFGLQEFDRWCKSVGAQTIMTLNMGTRGVDAARNLLEYANHPGGTAWSDLRIAHGHPEPYGIRTWCLGNELDGDWQIAHKTPDEYARLVRQTAHALKQLDPSLCLIANGSSNNDMRTYPEWDRAVLLSAYDHLDMIATHKYIEKGTMTTGEYMASVCELERQLTEMIAVCDYARAAVRSPRPMMIALDEYMTVNPLNQVWPALEHPWQTGVPLCDKAYRFESALVLMQMLLCAMRHCDRVRIACQSMLVNVSSLIHTTPEGPAWRDVTYYPLQLASAFGEGVAMRSVMQGSRYDAGRYGEQDAVDHLVIYREQAEELVVFAVNRTEEPILLQLEALNYGGSFRLARHVLYQAELQASNTADAPDCAAPAAVAVDGEAVVLGPYSIHVLTYAKQRGEERSSCFSPGQTEASCSSVARKPS